MNQPEVSASASPSSVPTTVRYRIILLAMLVAVLLYLDRICMSTAAEAVAADLKISKENLDYVLGAFFLTYALGQLPAGWLGDRFGARWMLGAYIILWSLSTGLMGFATGLAAVLWLRLACGLFEAGAYPVAASIVRRWVPMKRRGFASSVIAVGGRIGGALAPIITIQLMLWWTLGDAWWTAPDDARADITSWRPVMMLYGAAGIVIAILFMIWFRDWPDLHPKVNQAERDLIRGDEAPLTSTAKPLQAPPMMAMIKSWPLWMNCVVQFAANLGWAFLVTKMPQYLKEVFSSTQQAQGWLQSLPLAAGIAGLLMGGMFTDMLTGTFGLRWGRSIAMATSRWIVAIAFFGLLYVDSAAAATFCLIIVGFATDLGTPACWAYGQDVGGRHVGSVVGWSNMWGNFGAAISPRTFGLFIGTAAATSSASGWHAAFTFCAILNIVAGLAALGINASKPLQVAPEAAN
jgi:ACS family glucarate transporter-like MFS transporter